MARRIGEDIDAKISVDYTAGILGLSLIPKTDEAEALLPAVMERILHAIMDVAEAEFGVKGTYLEKNKPPKIKSRM